MTTDVRGLVRVELWRCTAHDWYALLVNGKRVSSGKCCGSWDSMIRVFYVDPRDFNVEGA